MGLTFLETGFSTESGCQILERERKKVEQKGDQIIFQWLRRNELPTDVFTKYEVRTLHPGNRGNPVHYGWDRKWVRH